MVDSVAFDEGNEGWDAAPVDGGQAPAMMMQA